jgi:thioester reductase-like protein
MTQNQGKEESCIVLLTGSTGSLGCHLVAYLANLPIVKEVVCLIRPAAGRDQDPSNKQDEALRDRLIFLSPKVRPKITTIQATLSLPQLGLTSETYNSLRQRVTHLLHNAWPMNFNRRLSSFQSQFQAVRNLLRLALDAGDCDRSTHCVTLRNRVRFVFVSSIAVVGEYPDISKDSSPIPEMNISNVMYTNQIGYAEAKLVCERIVERAQDDFPTNLEAGSVRIGQMSGSKESGFWNTDEHIAALLKSSVANSALPALEGVCPPFLILTIISSLLTLV